MERFAWKLCQILALQAGSIVSLKKSGMFL